MTISRIRTAFIGGLALFVAGCVTDATNQPPPSTPYAPTELTDKSTAQLRAELESSLKQAELFLRRKPIAFQNDSVERVEVGEDYLFIRFKSALVAVNEPRRDEYFNYGFMFERLSDVKFDGDTCWTKGTPLPDCAVRFSTPIGPKVCDIIYTLGLRAQKQRDADAAEFARLAPQARGRTAEAVPESLRRLIVQADALRQEKNYTAAAAVFRKAIRQDPVAYPAAHFNLALLYEMLSDYPHAIESMQRYLLLQPQAADARAAQDKIYAWEMKAEQK